MEGGGVFSVIVSIHINSRHKGELDWPLQHSTPAPWPFFSPQNPGDSASGLCRRSGGSNASGWVFTVSSQLWSGWDTKETAGL